MELCADQHFRENQAVQDIRILIQERYSHLGEDTASRPPPFAFRPTQTVTPNNTAHNITPAIPPLAQPFPAGPTRPYDIFLSYSHVDESLMTLVREHLVVYDRLGRIRKWWDRKLLPGTPLDEAITNHLSSSDIILLFVSASFLASDSCYVVEMQQALRQHSEGRSVVVPVILRHCSWHDTPFGSLLALPSDGRPLTAWPDRDEAAKNIADGVMRIVADLHRRQQNG
jgi:hypothetical protein